MTNTKIHLVKETDIEEIAKIEKQLFSEPWSEESFLEALHREDNIFLVACCDEEIVGYALLYGMLDEGEIPTIATHPMHQKQGIATELLVSLQKECREKGIERIFLEVREGNLAAQRLYHKCGFEVVGKRKQFYRFPTEDALVMACQIKGELC